MLQGEALFALRDKAQGDTSRKTVWMYRSKMKFLLLTLS